MKGFGLKLLKRLYVLAVMAFLASCNARNSNDALSLPLNDDQKLILALRQIALNRFTITAQDYFEQSYFNTVYSERFYDARDRSSLFQAESPFYKELSDSNTDTQRQLLAIVNRVFNDFRLYYALYSFYGGDQRFTQAYNELLTFVQQAEGLVSPSLFVQAISDSLGFLIDEHLAIQFQDIQYHSKSKLERPNVLVWLKELILEPLQDGKWFTIIDEERYILDPSKNEKMLGHIYPVIQTDGSIIWQIFYFLSTEESKQPILVTIYLDKSDTGASKTFSITPSIWPRAEDRGVDKFSFREGQDDSGAYWLSVDSFGGLDESVHQWLWNGYTQDSKLLETNRQIQELSRFFDTAEKLKSVQVGVIDISKNSGGTDTIPYTWLKHYGYPVLSDNKLVQEDSDAVIPYYADLNQCQANNRHIATPLKIIDADYPLMFVLQSKVVASAGEGFLSQLREHSNTILLGEPSWGAMLAGNATERYYVYLYGNIKITIPTKGFVYRKNVEERGFLPDFFIQQENIASAIDSFLIRYRADYVKKELRSAFLKARTECYNYVSVE